MVRRHWYDYYPLQQVVSVCDDDTYKRIDLLYFMELPPRVFYYGEGHGCFGMRLRIVLRMPLRRIME